MKILVVLLSVLYSGACFSEPSLCTYQTYKWNTHTHQAEAFEQVQKPYSAITKEEIDELTSCTVCQEDQIEVIIGDIKPFKLCKKIAADIQYAIEEAISLGQLVVEIVGYRVGKTKGDVDKYGYRLQFSNHSFGIAFDINPMYNGLYDNCLTYNINCRLIKGGQWHPNQPESLRESDHVVRIMKSIGFNWGGTILGRQKDYMHFSLSGY